MKINIYNYGEHTKKYKILQHNEYDQYDLLGFINIFLKCICLFFM